MNELRYVTIRCIFWTIGNNLVSIVDNEQDVMVVDDKVVRRTELQVFGPWSIRTESIQQGSFWSKNLYSVVVDIRYKQVVMCIEGEAARSIELAIRGGRIRRWWGSEMADESSVG